jgi:2-polyprenyl-6-methoxyphenol hydroxylase-like FAD-dependent oxidoreductase
MRGRRADLAAILHEAARDDAEFPFNDSIPALRQDAGGVDVTFHRTSPRRFDLVLGADGLHSAVRGLVFGPEADCVRHLGLYVTTLPLGQPATDPDTVLLHNRPGGRWRCTPLGETPRRRFIFRGPAIPDLDRQDTERHRRVVLEAYRDGGYRLAHRPG